MATDNKSVTQRAQEKITENANAALSQHNVELRDLKAYYTREKSIPVYLSPMYRPYLGRVADITVNGVTIFLPVDGQVYEIPETFADLVNQKRMAIDAMLTKQQRMSDVQVNHEHSPGELKLF